MEDRNAKRIEGVRSPNLPDAGNDLKLCAVCLRVAEEFEEGKTGPMRYLIWRALRSSAAMHCFDGPKQSLHINTNRFRRKLSEVKNLLDSHGAPNIITYK